MIVIISILLTCLTVLVIVAYLRKPSNLLFYITCGLLVVLGLFLAKHIGVLILVGIIAWSLYQKPKPEANDEDEKIILKDE